MKCCPSSSRSAAAPTSPRWTQGGEDLATLSRRSPIPTRVAIVNRLACGEALRLRPHRRIRPVAADGLAPSAVLRDAGLVEAERRGTWAYYRLVPDAIDRLRDVFSTPALVPA